MNSNASREDLSRGSSEPGSLWNIIARSHVTALWERCCFQMEDRATERMASDHRTSGLWS